MAFKFNLLENEEIIARYRQTETVLFKPVLLMFVFIYFPWLFLLKYELAATYDMWLLTWTLLVFLYAITKYILWLLNTYLVTNKRIVCIKYVSLFDKRVNESPLERILNISYSSRGFWAVLFKFGSVEIQVTGLTEPIIFNNVAKPSEIKDFLWKIHNPEKQTKISSGYNLNKTNIRV